MAAAPHLSPTSRYAAGYKRIIIEARAGAVIGVCGCSAAAHAINLCTWGLPGRGLSHVAIVARHPSTRRDVLWESTSLATLPCMLGGQIVAGVQCHAILERCRAETGHIWYYPPTRPLSEYQSERLTGWLYTQLGRPYDLAGACRARSTPLAWIARLWRGEDLRQEFCSELVAAALGQVGLIERGTASGWSPNALVRYLVRSGSHARPWQVQ